MDSPAANRTVSPLTYWAAAAFLPVLVFVSIPNTVLIENLFDLQYSFRLTAISLLFFIVTSLLMVPLFRAGSAGASSIFPRVAIATGLSLLALNTLKVIVGQYATPLPWSAVIDIAALVSIFIAISRVKLNSLYNLAAFIAIGLTAHAALAHTTALLEERRKDAQRMAETIIPPETPLPVGNIYHILLDGFQREAYQTLINESPGLALPGFEFFPQFTASYASTRNSLPNMLTGRNLAKGESILDWQIEATTSGLWNDLALAGMALTFYPYFDDECPRHTGTCISAMSLGRDSSGTTGLLSKPNHEERQLIDFWFLLLIPQSLQQYFTESAIGDNHKEALSKSNDDRKNISLTRFLFGDSSSRESAAPNPVPTDTRPEASVYLFRQMLKDESSRPATGQYVYLHAHLPHAPYKVDENCSPSPGGFLKNLLAQSTCGINLVKELLSTLDQLNRLDDAIIIVHSDHGAFPPFVVALLDKYPQLVGTNVKFIDEKSGALAEPDSEHSERIRKSGKSFVPFRSGALLLLKQRGADEFSLNQSEVQMIDIAPTILASAGIKQDKYPGYPIGYVEVPADRTHQFYLYKGKVFLPLGERLFFNSDGGIPSALEKAALQRQKPKMQHFEQDNSGWRYKDELEVEY